jgi:hypothetical protein
VRDKPAGPRTFQAGGMTDTKDRLFIGGEWVAPATTATIDVVSPHSTQVIARVPDGSRADLDRAVADKVGSALGERDG